MHVMHLIDSGGLYGAEKMLLGLAKASLAKDAQVTLLSVGDIGVPEKPIETMAKSLDLPLICLRMKNGLNLALARKVVDEARRLGVDLLHSHGYKFNILMGLLPKTQRLPCLSTVHGYVHSPVGTKMWCYEWLDRKMLKRLERVVFVSEETCKHPRVRSLKVAGGQVIANGMDWQSEITPYPLPKDIETFIQGAEHLLLAVGRLSREKGFSHLLHAMADMEQSHPGTKLLIVGEGGQREFLTELTDRLGLNQRVLMPGFSDQIPALLQRADLFVMPSLTEGLPMALLEAMASGTPVVASAVGGIPDVLEQGKCGVLVPPADDVALSKGIASLLDDPEKAAITAAKARVRQLENYSVGAMTDAYLALYQDLLAGSH
ncbi:glycosyltransferase family 4 protein [Corallincola platygyrae]|uniref:Glycosyltransferase family 4 protein n=1 Tax=Corallincola platygyrae TaxID=1193278 RepID=A0ABW4XK93_9GAMM